MKLAILLFATVATFGEPLLTFPIGSPEDVRFFDEDLLDVGLEFPQEPGAYFGNAQQTVICIPSLLNPADQECSTKAEPWTQHWVVGVSVQPTVTVPPHAPPPAPPPVVTTPEPVMLWLLLVMIAAMVTWRRQLGRKVRETIRHFLFRYSRTYRIYRIRARLSEASHG
jgi:hypothetical protein